MKAFSVSGFPFPVFPRITFRSFLSTPPMFRHRFPLVLAVLTLVGATSFAEDDPAAERQFADGLMSRHLFPRAAAEYENLIRKYPDLPERDVVLFRWGEALRETGRTDESDAVFARLLAECPDSEYRVRALFKRGTLAQEGGRHGDAAGYFWQMLEAGASGENRENALYFLAEALCRDNRRAESVPCFETLLTEFPSGSYAPYAKLSLAVSLAESDAARATALLRESASSPNNAIAAEALFLLGSQRQRAGDYAASADAFAELRSRFPSSSQAEEAALQTAWSFEQANRHADILPLAAVALARPDAPKRDEWHYLRGRALFHLGRHAEAAAALMALVNEKPSSPLAPRAVYEAALAREKEGRFDEAFRILPLIPATDALRPRALHHMGLCAEQIGDADKAIDAYRELADKFPEDADAPDALYRLASLHQKAGRHAEAAAVFLEYEKRFPSAPQAAAALFSAGFCLREAGDREGAMNAWADVGERHADSPFAIEADYWMGVEAYRADNPAEALFRMDRCLKAGGGPHLADATFWRAVLLVQLERNAEALEALRKSEAMSPAPDRLEEIRSQLWTVLQRLDRRDEAADVLDPLLASPAAATRIRPEQAGWAIEHQYFRGRLNEALRLAKFITEHSPSDEWRQTAWAWVGRIQARLGDAAAAEVAFRAAADVPVETLYTAEAHLRVGEYRFAAHDYAAAETRFLKALDYAQPKELETQRVKASIGLARAWRELGRKEDAARQLLGICMFYRDDEIIPPLIEETLPLLRELGQNDEADALARDLESMKGETATPTGGSADTPLAEGQGKAPTPEPAP